MKFRKFTIVTLTLIAMLFSVSQLFAEEGLEVYYDFEENDAVDQSGNGRDGSVEGNPKLVDGVKFVGGRIDIQGKAWEFDGQTVINLDFPMMKEPDPQLSIRCFFKAENTNLGVIYDEGGAWSGFAVRLNQGNLEFATVCCGENHKPPVIISTEFTDTDNWHDLAAVYDNGVMSLYLDGEKVGEEKTDWKEIAAHGQDGAIGYISPGDTAFGPGGDHYIGAIDEFRIYSRALQSNEVRLSVSSKHKLSTTWGALKFGVLNK